jgi:hypothetical protein
LAAFFLGAAFLAATAVPALVVVFFGAGLGVAFLAARLLVAVAFTGVALAAALAGALLLALVGEVDFDFLLVPNTFDQPSAYLLFVPTRVIVTV